MGTDINDRCINCFPTTIPLYYVHSIHTGSHLTVYGRIRRLLLDLL